VRQAYAETRALLIEALQPALGDAVWISSQSAGLHLIIRLPDDCDDQRIAQSAADHGVRVGALSRYYIGPASARGLVVGYGYAATDKVARSGRTLAQLLKAL
jgi:GntR family transcriptional regulator/MocR family aminotransferase